MLAWFTERLLTLDKPALGMALGQHTLVRINPNSYHAIQVAKTRLVVSFECNCGGVFTDKNASKSPNVNEPL